MNLILKSTGSDFVLPDIGVIITTGGSDFSGIPGLIRALGQSVNLRNRVIAGTVVVNNGASDLSVLAGQQYLNQMWLQAGNDIAVQMGQVEGVITDTQHGTRAGGTNHPVVTGSVNGYMASADKTKLDGISASAKNRITLTFGNQVASGVEQTGAAFLSVRYFLFPGTTAFGTPTVLKAIAQRASGGSNCIVVIYDVTNGNEIARIDTIAAGTPTIYTDATLTNLPAAEAILRLDISGGGAGTKINCHAITLE